MTRPIFLLSLILLAGLDAPASADESTQLPFDLKEAIRASLRMADAELRGRVTVTLRMDGETQVIGSVGRMSQVFDGPSGS